MGIVSDDNGGLRAGDPIEVECPNGCGTVLVGETLFSPAIQVPLPPDTWLGVEFAGAVATVPPRATGWRLSCGCAVSGDLYNLILLPTRRAELRSMFGRNAS